MSERAPYWSGRFVKVPWSILEEEWAYDNRKLAKYVRDLIAQDMERRKRRRAYIPALVWQGILAAFGFRCAYCGVSDVPLQKEHRVPLARGGEDHPRNIVPACRPCNQRKFTADPTCWPIVVPV